MLSLKGGKLFLLYFKGVGVFEWGWVVVFEGYLECRCCLKRWWLLLCKGVCVVVFVV